MLPWTLVILLFTESLVMTYNIFQEKNIAFQFLKINICIAPQPAHFYRGEEIDFTNGMRKLTNHHVVEMFRKLTLRS